MEELAARADTRSWAWRKRAAQDHGARTQRAQNRGVQVEGGEIQERPGAGGNGSCAGISDSGESDS